ncbi:MAG: HAD family hydrolase [Mariprofundaceae bacterium]
MHKKQCQAVLLDMDGTIVDAFAPIVYALNKTLVEFGHQPMTADAIHRHTGRGECSMISLFGERREEAANRFLQFHDEKIYDVKPIEGAAPLLRWLQDNKLPVAIVTSKSQSRAELQLEHLQWTHYFTAIIGLTPERRQKPDPHTVQLACKALKVIPEKCVMIGDGTADMKAASASGCKSIGMTGTFSGEELQAAGASTCCTTLMEAKLWLQKNMMN